MNNYYFTFGTDPLFPYGINDYVVVCAEDIDKACTLFDMVHPKRPGSSCTNCAFIYTEEKFNSFREKYYKDVQPSEVICLRVMQNFA